LNLVQVIIMAPKVISEISVEDGVLYTVRGSCLSSNTTLFEKNPSSESGARRVEFHPSRTQTLVTYVLHGSDGLPDERMTKIAAETRNAVERYKAQQSAKKAQSGPPESSH
jgi:hypothetical protein